MKETPFMKKLFAPITAFLLPSTDVSGATDAPEDIPYKEITSSPVYHAQPVVVYNPGSVSAILAAAILSTERGWRCFKAGETLPDSEQYLWLGVTPNRKLFSNAPAARKRAHFVFIENLHPMRATVGFSGKFHLAFTNWVYKHGKPRAFEFLVRSALNKGESNKYRTLLELAHGFYKKNMPGIPSTGKVAEDMSPVAYVYKNVLAATHSLNTGIPFVVTGIEEQDLVRYYQAILAVRESLRDMRVATVYVKGEETGQCCFTCVKDNFWLAKRMVSLAYPYYVNTAITLNGMLVDTNVGKVPEQYIDEIVVC